MQNPYGDLYDNGSFFYKVKSSVYKWWCVVYKPVYKLVHKGYFPPEKEPDNLFPKKRPVANSTEDKQRQLAEQMAKEMADRIMSEQNGAAMPISNETANSNPINSSAEFSDTYKNTQDNKDNKANQNNQDDIMNKLSSIMKANEIDISPYIEEGKANFEELQKKELQEKQQAASSENDDALFRAQEIIDRLNREAAEDEAKKQAEIDAIKIASGIEP